MWGLLLFFDALFLILLEPSVGLLALLCLIVALLRAQMGYLHLCNACLWWSSSLLSNCGLELTILVLCVKVLKTLNLAARLWWLSHCKYRSVWVGCLYTVVARVVRLCHDQASKKGMNPSFLVYSTVNLMCGSMLLMCLRNLSFFDDSMITKMSSTNLFQTLGGCSAVFMAFISKSFV